MSWTTLCELSELIEGQGKYVEIDGFQLAVFLDKGNVFAIDNCCPHAGGNLSGGHVADGCAVCPWHYWAFRLTDGQLRDMPGVNVATYTIRLFDHAGKRFVQANLPMP